MTELFESFVKEARIEIISCAHIQVGPLVDKYFAAHPPFEKTEAKKSEFPDAITIACLDAWAEANGLILEVVSNDSGVRKACVAATRLHPVASLTEVLASITAAIEGEQRVNRAMLAFRSQMGTIAHQVAEAFSDLQFSIEDDYYPGTYVNRVDVRAVSLENPLLVYLEGDERADFDVKARIKFSADVSLDDPEATAYDPEEGKQYVYHTIHGEVIDEVLVDVDLELQLGKDGRVDSPVRAVNHGDGIEINLGNFTERPRELDE